MTIRAAVLLPHAVAHVDNVLTQGGEKHGDAWMHREDTEDVVRALRHVQEYVAGIRVTDFGASPLAHAVARLMMVIEREVRDDAPGR